MSLRDQLVAKGLATKNDKRRAERALKQKRKTKQGKRERKHLVAERAAAEASADLEAALAERRQSRALADSERQALEERLRVRRMVLDSQVRGRGSLRFHFKKLDGRHIDFLSVHPKVGRQLRAGQAGIAAAPTAYGDGPETYHVVPARTARRLLEVAERYLVFFVEETDGIGAPEEDFLDPDWDISLAPHRA